MEVSFDADVATEHGIRAAVVLNHIAHLMRFPDGSQAGHFNTCGRAYVHVSPEYLWSMTAPIKAPARKENIYGGSS